MLCHPHSFPSTLSLFSPSFLSFFVYFTCNPFFVCLLHYHQLPFLVPNFSIFFLFLSSFLFIIFLSHSSYVTTFHIFLCILIDSVLIPSPSFLELCILSPLSLFTILFLLFAHFPISVFREFRLLSTSTLFFSSQAFLLPSSFTQVLPILSFLTQCNLFCPSLVIPNQPLVFAVSPNHFLFFPLFLLFHSFLTSPPQPVSASAEINGPRRN